MRLVVTRSGTIRCIYDEAVDLAQLGPASICRGSFVEPDSTGKWLADLAPVSGPVLGPFAKRSQALAAEIAWLDTNWLV
jgi:hypothetical protein